MTKVSDFPGRKPIAEAVAGTIVTPEGEKAIVTTGGDQGGFQRPPCGTCHSWRKLPMLGVGQGTCMAMPPVPQAILDNNGRPIGQIATRLGRRANDEGCDMHDDGSEDEDEDEDDDGPGGPRPGQKLMGVGESRAPVYGAMPDHATMEAIRRKEERRGYKMSAAMMGGTTMLAALVRENEGAPLTDAQLRNAASHAERFAEYLAERMLPPDEV